jgi:hypothetical protein
MLQRTVRLRVHPRLDALADHALLCAAAVCTTGARNLRQARPAPVCSATAVSQAQASGGGTAVSAAEAQVRNWDEVMLKPLAGTSCMACHRRIASYIQLNLSIASQYHQFHT